LIDGVDDDIDKAVDTDECLFSGGERALFFEFLNSLSIVLQSVRRGALSGGLWPSESKSKIERVGAVLGKLIY
jgi:hypothetical protein